MCDLPCSPSFASFSVEPSVEKECHLSPDQSSLEATKGLDGASVRVVMGHLAERQRQEPRSQWAAAAWGHMVVLL